MRVFCIGDLHLSLSGQKPMEKFGQNWYKHYEKIKLSFDEKVGDDDITVLCGDISWAMNLEGAKADFDFIDKLKGKKIILKGNHDYWWNTVTKMRKYLSENGFYSIDFLHNNAYETEKFMICGSRGWFYDEGAYKEPDEKVLAREMQRIKTSFEYADKLNTKKEKVLFLHYPPVFDNYCLKPVTDLIKEHGVKRCYYGHIHAEGIKKSCIGEYDGIEYNLISADNTDFSVVEV